MTRSDFVALAKTRDLELANLVATLYGIPLAVRQLWSITA